MHVSYDRGSFVGLSYSMYYLQCTALAFFNTLDLYIFTYMTKGKKRISPFSFPRVGGG